MLRLSFWSQDDSHHVTYLFPILGSNTSRKTSPHLAPFRCFLFMLFYSPLLRFRWVGRTPSTKPKLPPPFSLRFTRHKKYISLDSLSPHYVFGIHLDIPLHYGFVAFVSTLFLKTPSLIISSTPYSMLRLSIWSQDDSHRKGVD